MWWHGRHGPTPLQNCDDRTVIARGVARRQGAQDKCSAHERTECGNMGPCVDAVKVDTSHATASKRVLKGAVGAHAASSLGRVSRTRPHGALPVKWHNPSRSKEMLSVLDCGAL